MPLNRYAVQCHVGRDAMCEVASLAVEDLMRHFVRDLSPDWSTVRMDIARGPMEMWVVRLYGEGIRRGDLYGQGIRGDHG